MLSSCNINTDKSNLGNEKGIQHGIVYYGEGRFAAWPANNGLWSWDNNEILVGFTEGLYDEKAPGLHSLYRPSSSRKYARSKDGGIHWTIEDAYENGQTTMGTADKRSDSVAVLTEKINDFTNPDFILTIRSSHFYYSSNRGKKWIGPYGLPNMNTDGLISRTDYIVEGKQQIGAFLTVNKSNRKEGRVVYARTDDGALNWKIVSWIGTEPGGFDIMPSSVRLSPMELFTTIRTKTVDSLSKITSHISRNNGITWEQLRDPVADTGRGGSPPALVKLADGRLALGYAYRSEHGSRINVRFSSDNGKSWSDEIILRGGDGASRDVGYPRMLQRPDGKLVIIYYWNNALLEGAKPYRYIASTIFDPNMWNK